MARWPEPRQARSHARVRRHRPGAQRRRRPRAVAVAAAFARPMQPLLRQPARRLGRAHRRRVGRSPGAAGGRAAPHVKPAPERVLEVGTGTGEGALFLAREFPQASVRGVDISEGMIRARAEQGRPRPGGPGRLRVADAAGSLRRRLLRPRHPAQHAAVLRRDRPRAAPGGPRRRRRQLRRRRRPSTRPSSVLERGFRRRGIEPVDSRRGRPTGTYWVGREPRELDSADARAERRLLLLVNPSAGGGRAATLLPERRGARSPPRPASTASC